MQLIIPNMTQLCHYTDDQGAENIIRSGSIMASLKISGDAVFGNGVYLTKLKPESSTRAQVALNNWLSKSDHSLKKTKNVFVLEIPDNEVENVSTDTRNIFKFGGRKDLRLVKYKWYLQDFETGKIIASHKYHIGSTGPFASSTQRKTMGDYVMTEETVNGRPVYEHPGYNHFLFMASCGNWLVGGNTDKDGGWLQQKDNYSLGPGAEGAWDYGVLGADGKGYWKRDDATLKAYPSYMCSQWKTDFHSDSSGEPGSSKPAITPSSAPATRTNSNNPTTTDTTAAPATTGVNLATNPATRSNTHASTPAATTPASTTATTSASTTASSLTTTATTPPPSVLPKSTATSSNMPDPDGDNLLQSSASTLATTPAPPPFLSKSRPTSSKVPDPDIDNGLLSPGSTRSGRVFGGPPGKTTGVRRRLAAMLQWYPFKEKSSSKRK